MRKHVPPKILKAIEIRGKNLVFRNIATADAEFVLRLRTDPARGRHLSRTDGDLDGQIAWLESYRDGADQAYFIIERGGARIGTVRLYNAVESSFCWGSWIILPGQPPYASIESALMVYSYALDHLGFTESHFDVRKENKTVWSFHERFGAQRVAETDLDFLYKIDYQAIRLGLERYNRFLQGPVSVVMS